MGDAYAGVVLGLIPNISSAHGAATLSVNVSNAAFPMQFVLPLVRLCLFCTGILCFHLGFICRANMKTHTLCMPSWWASHVCPDPGDAHHQ